MTDIGVKKAELFLIWQVWFVFRAMYDGNYDEILTGYTYDSNFDKF